MIVTIRKQDGTVENHDRVVTMTEREHDSSLGLTFTDGRTIIVSGVSHYTAVNIFR